MYNRAISDKIIELKEKFPVVLVTGPRQSGKSTLLKQLFGNYKYVNLESLDIAKSAKNDPIGFLENYDEYTIIDEVQRVPELLSYIQVKVDESENKGVYILSGSQNLLLMDSVSQSLAGRVAIFNLLPLSLKEYNNKEIKAEEWIFNGSYPGALANQIEHYDFYSNYMQTYIERDVRLLKNIQDLSQFTDFVAILAGRVGSLIDYTDIANIVGISVMTVKRWISILETSFIVFKLPPYYKNYEKRITKSYKIYFYDTGIVTYLLKINSAEELKTHTIYGHLFENMVLLEIIKKNFNNARRPQLYFWRDSKGNEIDLLIPMSKGVDVFEIKSSKTLKLEFAKTLNMIEKISGEVNSKTVYFGGDEEFIASDKARYLSWKNLMQ